MHFTEGKFANKSEAEIFKDLGDPVEIAKELNAVYAIKKVNENKNIKNIYKAILSIMGLLFKKYLNWNLTIAKEEFL